MPRPFRPPSGRPPRSSRRRARWAATRAAMVMANQASAAVSWLACGSPSDTQVRVVLSRLSAARPSRAQHEAAARFLARARPFARRGSLNLRGGRAVVASQLPPLLKDATYNRTRPCGDAHALPVPDAQPQHTAQPQHAAQPREQPAVPPAPACSHVIAERVSLPTAGATVPIAQWLPSEWQARLARPDGLLRPDCRAAFGFQVRPEDPPQLDATSVGDLIPRPVFLISRAEYRKLLVFLRKVGLVTFRDPRSLPKHPVTGRVLSAGILGADKKSGAQRLLLDRRPQNAIEERLVGLSLPFAGDFVRFELGPSEVIRTSLRDGKDQYYVLRPDDARVAWQAFGQPVDSDWFPDDAIDGAPWLQPCFLGLMQGDHNAADIAEAVGRAILCDSGAFPVDDLMPAGRGPRMRRAPGQGVALVSDLYIDDAAVIAMSSPHIRSPCAQRTAAATKALRDAGVEVHAEKGHDDALDGAVWGGAFYRHIVSAERQRLCEIDVLSWSVACGDVVVPSHLSTLLGYWSHACLFRRAGFAVLQDAYETARDPSPGPVPLKQSVRTELLLLSCLLPLLSSDLRAPVCSSVVATDATVTRGAAVAATVSPDVARRLFAGADFRGSDAHLVDRIDLSDEDAALPADPEFAAALAQWQWRVTAAYDMESDHINAQELRVFVNLVVRRCRSAANAGQRLVALLDNQAASGAAAKGRSSSRRMNRLLRRLAAFLFAADLYIAPRYVPSGVNPADPPSRRRSLLAWLERARRAGRVFDSTCGYPGEGPPRRSWSERAAMRPAARLADGGVRPATLSLRASAGSDFDVFLAVTGRPSAAELAAEARSFDEAMIEYLQELWQRGAPRSVAQTAAQYGPSAFPLDLRQRLPGTTRAMQAWSRLDPGEFRQPLPMLVAHALLVLWLSEHRWAAAIVLILMLSGVMRPGEAASLRRRHLSLPEDHGVAGLVIIVIVDPKTAHLGGAAIQHATLEEPAAIPLLRWFLADVPPDAFLWAGPSYDARLASFEYAFKRALARLRLEELGFTPASVRAGAATAIWIRTFNTGLI